MPIRLFAPKDCRESLQSGRDKAAKPMILCTVRIWHKNCLDGLHSFRSNARSMSDWLAEGAVQRELVSVLV